MPKNNLLKMDYNKKIDSFAYLIWSILKKKMNQIRNADELSVEMVKFVIIEA
jgi:hypothetical protein